MRIARRSVAAGSVLVVMVAGAGASLAFVNTQKPDKVDICHASNSTSNPYVTNQVDTSSVDLNGHVNHTGPIYSEGMESGWGDIIPPVPEILPDGLNWQEGQATLLNGCKFVSPSPSPTPTETSSPSPTPTETSSPTPTPTETSSPTPTPTETSSPTPTPTETSSPTPTPTPTGTPTSTSTPTTPSTGTPVPAPVTTVSPASPETPAAVDADEVAPVEIADPGALPAEQDSAAVEPAAPQQSVPTSVPAGGGAARSSR